MLVHALNCLWIFLTLQHFYINSSSLFAIILLYICYIVQCYPVYFDNHNVESIFTDSVICGFDNVLVSSCQNETVASDDGYV